MEHDVERRHIDILQLIVITIRGVVDNDIDSWSELLDRPCHHFGCGELGVGAVCLHGDRRWSTRGFDLLKRGLATFGRNVRENDRRATRGQFYGNAGTDAFFETASVSVSILLGHIRGLPYLVIPP